MKQNMRVLTLVCILAITSLCPAVSVAALPSCQGRAKNPLTLTFLETTRHGNGQVSQSFAFNCTAAMANTFRAVFQENQRSEFFQVSLTGNTFTISVDKPSRIRLFVFAGTRIETHVVHTNLVLFGNSTVPVKRHRADEPDVALIKKLPYIQLLSARNYYWHQTGVPLTFSIDNILNLPAVDMKVQENKTIRHLLPNDVGASGQFTYTPPEDEWLRQSGSTASRQSTLFTSFTHGGMQYRLSYVLSFHRSRFAHNDHKAGAAIFFIGIALFSGLVLYKRRKPWWQE